MRFLHTSDWHFGRTLHGTDLHEAYELWSDHVVEVAHTRDLDAVLISGDIFDRGIPPVAMVQLLSRTLEQLAEHTMVILTAGNHDAPTRLGFTAGLLQERVVIATDPLKIGTPIEVRRGEKPVGYVYALPYLEPDIERVRLAPDPESPLARSHEAVVQAAMDRVRESIDGTTGDHPIDNSLPTIVMAHEFVVGGEPSESERDLHIGGVDSVPSGVFDICVNGKSVIDYVALGHLHGPQQVHEKPLMRYAGSPLPFSFSEEHHKKSSVLVSIEQAGDAPEIELIPAPIYRPLATLRGTFDELMSSEYARYRDHFLRIFVTDIDRPERMLARLRQNFPYVLEAHHDIPRQDMPVQEVSLAKVNPVEVLSEFFATAGGRELNPEELALMTAQWEQLGKEEK
ncbi:exonuclease SbcCD subunit D [Arcanobacterium phocisimile]|uniref:Nuclease SbcCD subunit D n=1 Tax=Arcanobacterium phocisimile TaxID=1302235 RepID=A0ABX7IH73_9ACTO|nr:exonuclease SbcCD subunit D [Arcanobacterium phocisimile]QRV02473.1 exonuclease SbcCD subunit D [Arcanobacterium phocisimile]